MLLLRPSGIFEVVPATGEKDDAYHEAQQQQAKIGQAKELWTALEY